MKRFLIGCLVLCAFILPLLSTNTAFAEAESFVVTANYASVFSSPDMTSEKIGKLSHRDVVELQMQNGEPEIFGEEWKFYGLKDGGFVLCDLVTKQSNVVTQIPNFNAKTNAGCDLLFQQDLTMEKSGIHLAKGTKLFLYQGFKKTTYTAVAILYENEIVYGYVKTSCISPNGINPIIITCAGVILAVLGIIFAWLFMKKRKTKK